jgi:hypothetical protein
MRGEEEADGLPAARRLSLFPSVRSRLFLTVIIVELRTICVRSLHSVNQPRPLPPFPSPRDLAFSSPWSTPM